MPGSEGVWVGIVSGRTGRVFAGDTAPYGLARYGVDPCLADVNEDCIVDNGDITAFVSLFLASDSAADTNNDGILDNGDILMFVQLFLAGC